MATNLIVENMAKADLKIDWATHEAAKYACKNWHYSGCVPKSKLVKIGVWENGGFVGVVIFGVGATSTLVKQYGLTPEQGCELVRIALKKHQTPVTRIMRIACKFLKESNPKLRLIVSFADGGEGHHGGIYQGANWIYSGRSADCRFPIINGKKTHPRTLSLMVKDGRIKKRSDVPHVLAQGKHRYLMPLDDEMRKQIEPLAKPYPKRAKQAMAGPPVQRQGSTDPHAPNFSECHSDK